MHEIFQHLCFQSYLAKVKLRKAKCNIDQESEAEGKCGIKAVASRSRTTEPGVQRAILRAVGRTEYAGFGILCKFLCFAQKRYFFLITFHSYRHFLDFAANFKDLNYIYKFTETFVIVGVSSPIM